MRRRKTERVTRIPLPVRPEGRDINPEPHPPANSQKSAGWDSFVEEVCRQIDYIYSEAGRGMNWVVNAYQCLVRNYVTEDWAALMDLARDVQVTYEETRDEVEGIQR